MLGFVLGPSDTTLGTSRGGLIALAVLHVRKVDFTCIWETTRLRQSETYRVQVVRCGRQRERVRGRKGERKRERKKGRQGGRG